MSKKEEAKLSPLYSISDLKGYLWRRNMYDNLWRYHSNDPEINHQTYLKHETPIIKVKDTQDDLERYSEIMDNNICLETHKRTKYDVDSPVINIKGSIPDIGIEVVEVTDYYHSGDLTSGLFVYLIKPDSVAYLAGIKEGDVIVKVKRPSVETCPPQLWDKHVSSSQDKQMKSYEIKTIKDMMSLFNVIYPDEKLIFVINRNGNELELNMSIPFKITIYQRVEVPKVVIKKCPDMYMKNGYWYLEYKYENEYTKTVFNNISCDVDENMYLVLDTPDTLIGYEFEIDDNGNLIVNYE